MLFSLLVSGCVDLAVIWVLGLGRVQSVYGGLDWARLVDLGGLTQVYGWLRASSA